MARAPAAAAWASPPRVESAEGSVTDSRRHQTRRTRWQWSALGLATLLISGFLTGGKAQPPSGGAGPGARPGLGPGGASDMCAALDFQVFIATQRIYMPMYIVEKGK